MLRKLQSIYPDKSINLSLRSVGLFKEFDAIFKVNFVVFKRKGVCIMDQIKIGKFIAERRKDLGYLQKDIAERLGISEIIY